ncbi:hypothetical protein BVX94_00995 [bacterium B17]|nr:hypothetical protein BVX94_00995 [bacterium B17]
MKLSLKVIPKSSKDCIAGWLDTDLKVRVRAPAERGKANASVEKLIADTLGVPRKSVQIIAGKTSSKKIIDIKGLSEAEVRQKLS